MDFDFEGVKYRFREHQNENPVMLYRPFIERTDLFYRAALLFWTLEVITLFEFQLIDAKRYVAQKYHLNI